MLRKTQLFFLFFFLLTVLQAQNDSNYNLLWKVEGNGLEKPSYLFGTMHVEDERAFNFADSVLLSLESVDAFANEIQFDSIWQEMFNMVFAGSTKNVVKDLLTEEEYQKLSERVEKEMGFSLEYLNLESPFILKMILNEKPKRSRSNNSNDNIGKIGNSDNSSGEKSTFVDGHLLGIAKTLGKKIYGLEKIEDQMESFETGTEEQQREVLLDLIDPEIREQSAEYLNELTEVYQEGDITKIEDFITPYSINDPILIKRNKVMVSSIERITKKESIFAAVGAAHLPGKEGIINLLKEKGYQLSPVGATFTGVAEQYEVDIMKMNWVETKNEEKGFTVEAPGELFKIDIVEGFSSWMYPDITNGGFYIVMEIPVPAENLGAEFTDRFYAEILNKGDTKEDNILSANPIQLEDGDGVEVILNKNGNINKMRYLVRYDKVWAISVGNDLTFIDSPAEMRFLNSFEVQKTEKDPTAETLMPLTGTGKGEWKTYVDEDGGASFTMPAQPQINKRYQDMGEDLGKATVIQHLLFDPKSANTFLYQHSIFPIGIYMENPHYSFREMETRLSASIGEIIDKDTLDLDGYQGMEYTGQNEKSYTKVRIYIRGNRSYTLIRSAPVKEEGFKNDYGFFDEFTFRPMKKCELTDFAKEDFKVTIPDAFKETNISEYRNEEDQLVFEFGLEALNTYSGGNYQLVVYEISEYQYTAVADSFIYYHATVNNVTWPDTLQYFKAVNFFFFF